MIVDNKYFNKTNNNLQIKERNIQAWIKNDSVKECYNCKKEFWIYLRKHHCRSCGRIFCYLCCQNYIKLPVDIEEFPKEPKLLSNYLLSWKKEESLQRVCNKCYNRLLDIQKVKELIQVFKILGYNILDLHKYSKVCHSWRKASLHLLSKFREIQYKLPTYLFTKEEKIILWNNRRYLVYHSKWILQLIKSIDYQDNKKMDELMDLLFSKKKRKVKCIYTMCTRYCSHEFTAEDAIELIRTNINSETLKAYISKSFIDISEVELLCYIPYITFYIKNNIFLEEIIFTRSINSIKVRTEFYWALVYNSQYDNSYFYNKLKDKFIDFLKKNINKKEIKKLCSTKNIIKCFENMYNNSLDNIEYKIKKVIKNNNYCPINPHIKYHNIDFKGIHIKNSATNPVIIPLYYYKKNIKYVDKVMFKNENLIKDQIITKIIQLIDIIIKKEENMDLDIIQYTVIPTGKNNGIIEMVDNSLTLYDILEKKQKTIQNFIIEHNKTKTIEDIRNRFIKSTAAYCVISYMLGIGDRHLDNIMVNQAGTLFHIDYGYILGSDPKYSSQNIRTTPDILDAMGGINSPDYLIFQDLCTKIYNCIRRHTNLFMNLLIMLTEIKETDITKKWLENEIIKRFEPGENSCDAKLHFVNKMNKSHNTYEATITDFLHKTYKESYVMSGLTNMVNLTTKSGSFILNKIIKKN
jgi:phosphatidylinositol 3-kinase